MDLSNIYDGVLQKCAETNRAVEGDYIEDGLLHCGKCHTPKQCRVELFGQERTPYCLCECETKKRDKEREEAERRSFLKKVNELRKTGFPESDMQRWTFENDDKSNPKLSTIARNYVANFGEFHKDGKGLLLFGEVGTGKTFAAACIANALIDKGIPVLMTNFARIANTVQGMWEGKQAYLDSLNEYPLLILDDLRAERKTEYMQEIVFNVIDDRYRAGLPLIVTSNLSKEEITNPSDLSYSRIFSRLLEMCYPYKVEGQDKRREKLKSYHKSMSEKLGV